MTDPGPVLASPWPCYRCDHDRCWTRSEPCPVCAEAWARAVAEGWAESIGVDNITPTKGMWMSREGTRRWRGQRPATTYDLPRELQAQLGMLPNLGRKKPRTRRSLAEVELPEPEATTDEGPTPTEGSG